MVKGVEGCFEMEKKVGGLRTERDVDSGFHQQQSKQLGTIFNILFEDFFCKTTHSVTTRRICLSWDFGMSVSESVWSLNFFFFILILGGWLVGGAFCWSRWWGVWRGGGMMDVRGVVTVISLLLNITIDFHFIFRFRLCLIFNPLDWMRLFNSIRALFKYFQNGMIDSESIAESWRL